MSKKNSAIKPNNKFYYFSFQYENMRFSDIFLGKGVEELNSPKTEKEIKDFLCELHKIDTNVEVFKNCMISDILCFNEIIQKFIKDSSKKISKADCMSYLNLYSALIGMNLIPMSEMTKNIGLVVKTDPVTGKALDVELSREVKVNPGQVINKVLVALNDFFQSWKNGLFHSLISEMGEVDEKPMDEVIFAMDLLLYSVMICVIEYKDDDLVTKSSEEKAKGYYKHLLDEEGNFLERIIETGDSVSNKEESVKKTESSERMEAPDLTGVSNNNKDRREETSEEFKKNNNSSESSEEELPNLIKVKK